MPDLTLSKYQVFADSGIDGMLDAQTQFIRQLYRVMQLGNINVHILYEYDPKRQAGHKIRILIVFSGNIDDSYLILLKNIVDASNISMYYHLVEIDDTVFNTEKSYHFLSTLYKKERILTAKIDDETQEFYVVPNWEMNEDARLYEMLKLLQSFNQPCVYRVDLYVEEELEERIHQSFEKPLSFLRNITNRTRGISKLSEMQREKREPNADETMHQYENWIKAVDGSAVFRCRISVLSDSMQISQLLLNSAIAECISSGNASLHTKQGLFSMLHDFDNIPESLHSQNSVPKSLQNWTTTFIAEEVAAFARLPVLYDGEIIEIPKETTAKHEQNGIILGKDKNDYPVVIPQKMLPKHMFVCGVPGSGKTNTMLHIANSLWNTMITDDNGNAHKMHIPFLVLEPAKREYRELALFDIPELLVFSPSACTNFPIRINPFEFPIGLTLSEHISKLCQVFEGAFPIAPPAPFILDRAIQAIYEKRGWNVKDINTGEHPYPIMQDLYDQFENELQHTKYDSEIRGNIQSVLEMRIGSLLRREMRDIFNAEQSTLSPEEWLTKPVIIELEALGEGPANFVTLLLCTLIRETLKAEPLQDKDKPAQDKDKPVRHVIFIEEAHNLIAPESQVQDGMDSNPKIAATAFVVKMLAEVRALREGIIIADQLPTAMAPEVIKNTNIKLVHRLTAQDDRGLVGSTMSASPMQMENMATYTQGQALYSYEKLLRPFEIQVSEVEQHGKLTPNDDELLELMKKKEGFCQLQKREKKMLYDSIVENVIYVLENESEKCRILFDTSTLDFRAISQVRLEKFLQRCNDLLKEFQSERNELLFRIQELHVEYVPADIVEELEELVKGIGVEFENQMNLFKRKYELMK